MPISFFDTTPGFKYAKVTIGMYIKYCLFLALAGLALAANRTTKDHIDVAYYYSVNNDQDGDFIVSQLIPELQNPNNDFLVLVLPYGGVQLISDDDGKYYCHGKNDVCDTNMIHVSYKSKNKLHFKSFYLHSFVSSLEVD